MAPNLLVRKALGVGPHNDHRGGCTGPMSLLVGFIAGLVIAGLQIAAGHASIDYQRTSFHGNALFATAVPVFLLPLAIAWGWTWVSDRWSRPSGPRLLLFTLALALAASSAFSLDYVIFPPDGANAVALADTVLLRMLFVLPVVALAAVLYWAFASYKLSASFGILALGYLGGALLAFLLPTLTMGAVAGTA